METAPVSKAAKRPNKTMRFLADIKDAIDVFDDEISSDGDPRATAYENFISSYQSAFAHIWPKIETADVKVVLQSVKDKELKELRRMTEVISSDSSRPTLITENRSVPVLEQILGSMVSRLPNQKPPDKDTCKFCFRHLPPQRTLENSSELRRFHAVRTYSPRMMRNSHHLLILLHKVDHTFIKEKEKPPPHLQLAERLRNLHLPRLQHPPRRKKHKKQMKSQKILDKTLQQKNYIQQTHYPPTVPILFRTYTLNNMLNFIISCFIG